MKLRNKKTGEIWDIGKIITNDYPSYETLKQINDDFDDIVDEDKYGVHTITELCGEEEE